MIPQKQLYRHDPENGVYGDCHRTAIACLLDFPVEEVPHWFEGIPADTPEDERCEMALKLEVEWLASHGLRLINIAYPGELSLEEVLQCQQYQNPGIRYLLGGTSVNRCGHTVICLGKSIVHDPSLDAEGDGHTIAGPMDDGLWWVSFIGKLV